MRVEARVFLAVAVFLVVSTIGYGWWTAAAEPRGLEWIGTVCILLSAGLCGIIGSYFAFVARRIDARPEDRDDAEIAEGAGELGFFSPGSYWPISMAAAAATAGLAAAFWQVWLLIIGVAAILLTVGGLLFEYYAGQNVESSNFISEH
ncbi:MAG TPA: cytochrome c oxidase subunit 4 [Mycobacteriales bacterium]|nr:cytochrome c oxidase subunit 4 [Mycobacteriales bacterium]